MLGFLEVGSGVLAGRGVAAADVAAGEAHAQLGPFLSGPEAFRAALAARGGIVTEETAMRAFLSHG